jgi:hypothetical protein
MLVTVAVAAVIPLRVGVAVIVVEPFFNPKAVTGTMTNVPVCCIVTDAGTVATAVSDDWRFIVIA